MRSFVKLLFVILIALLSTNVQALDTGVWSAEKKMAKAKENALTVLKTDISLLESQSESSIIWETPEVIPLRNDDKRSKSDFLLIRRGRTSNGNSYVAVGKSEIGPTGYGTGYGLYQMGTSCYEEVFGKNASENPSRSQTSSPVGNR